MPTKNRPSNTNMVSVPEGFMLVERSIWTEQQVEAATACITRLKGVPGMRDCDLAMAAIDAAQCKAPDISLSDLLPPPQPHPDPIAWMVGTAFWWTKEEAERDAAASGKTITPFGPMFDTVEVERLKQELLAARAQGRAEVVEMIAQLDAETGLDEFIGSHQIGCSDEWGSHWKEEALREHFDVDPAAAGELELARHSSYEIMLLEEERATLRAQLAETHELLRDALASHGVKMMTDPPQDPWKTRRIGERIREALSASAEPGAPIAWHVGGNGYDRICFEEPTDLAGCPCIQAIHDQRQLIELLKRYDLRDEEAPPDERAHGIPGTSFQRLNALANQGE